MKVSLQVVGLLWIPALNTRAFQPIAVLPVSCPRNVRPLFMAKLPDFDSNDPFAVLGLNPNDQDSLDKKVIKRAYKRLALKYHPDVATNRESTSEEKKRASDQFSKINAAYETLLGKREGNFASSSSTASSGGGWTPPHRRKPGSSYSSSSSSQGNTGTSLEDFMPKYDDAQYDTGGDSFGSIFSDLLGGVAGGVGSRGGAGVFMDFVDFLERNVDGYGDFSGDSRGNDDTELTYLLQTGTVDEVGEELDDTELVVQQLTTKLQNLEGELVTIQADLAASSRFSEKIALEEREAECKARKGVVENYLRKARKRLLSLQTRYKQLIVGGANDSKAGGKSTNRTWSSTTDNDSTTPGSTDKTGTSNGRRASSGNAEDAWKTEGFGSNGNSRGSGRRRSSRSSQRSRERSTSSTSDSSTQNQNISSPSSTTRASERNTSTPSEPNTGARSRTASRSTTHTNVPPHRRKGFYQEQQDKQRLRDLKVNDEFEKLKNELGL